MAIAPKSTPTNTTSLSSKCKRTKAMAIKQRVLKIKANSPRQRVKTDDSRSKSAAIDRACEVQASLPSQLPTFVKSMLPSHVTGCFWLGLPKKFCDLHLPKHDETIVLVDENEQEVSTKFLADKTGLSGGWRGFANAHKLLEGDCLVFQLIDQWKFRVYIIRCKQKFKQKVMKIKAKNPRQRVKTDENRDLRSFNRATEVQASLPSELPSFIKSMLPSHVAGGCWLGLPKKFCDLHLPKHDETIVLVDEDEQQFNTKFLADKTGLSGGWRGFANAHKLLEGDCLVFQLINHWKFRVYIVRVCGLNEIDGALGLLNLAPCGKNVYQHQIKNDSNNLQKAEDMDIDLHKQNIQENSLVVFDQSEDNNDYADSPVSEGLRFSQSVLQFKEIKNIDDFSIVVDDLVIDSEIPKHFQIKYYDLCHSQKTYLHESLLKGLNVKLAVGIILETITIADAIRACKVGITRDDFDIWDKTLKAFEEMGMKVGFLRARISKLVGLLFDSNKLLEAKKIEQVKAEDEMRIISKKLCGIKDVIKNLDVEIETLKLTGKNLELVFCREANGPW